MTKILLLAMIATGCAADYMPEASTTQAFQTCCDDYGCYPCGGGGDGGGSSGGGASACDTFNCTTDSQCKLVCGNLNAQCAQWTGDDGSTGGLCLNWQ